MLSPSMCMICLGEILRLCSQYSIALTDNNPVNTCNTNHLILEFPECNILLWWIGKTLPSYVTEVDDFHAVVILKDLR